MAQGQFSIRGAVKEAQNGDESAERFIEALVDYMSIHDYSIAEVLGFDDNASYQNPLKLNYQEPRKPAQNVETSKTEILRELGVIE